MLPSMIYGVTMVKNEQPTIAHSIEHLLAEGVDHIIVANNLSTDRTGEILSAIIARGWPVTVLEDSELAYDQGRKVTRLADMAREAGATWIIPFDADELWVSTTPGQTLAEVLGFSTEADVLVADWFDHLPPLSPGFGRPFYRRMPRRNRVANGLTKVAFRALPGIRVHDGNHDVDGIAQLRRVEGRIYIHHYRWRSLRHFVKKTRNGLRVMEAGGDALPLVLCSEWRRYGRRGLLHLALTYINLIRTQRASGTVKDDRQPTRLTQGTLGGDSRSMRT